MSCFWLSSMVTPAMAAAPAIISAVIFLGVVEGEGWGPGVVAGEELSCDIPQSTPGRRLEPSPIEEHTAINLRRSKVSIGVKSEGELYRRDSAPPYRRRSSGFDAAFFGLLNWFQPAEEQLQKGNCARRSPA